MYISVNAIIMYHKQILIKVKNTLVESPQNKSTMHEPWLKNNIRVSLA